MFEMRASYFARNSNAASAPCLFIVGRTKLTWDDAVKFTENCFAGACAAVVAKVVIAPIERVKLILQLQNSQTTLAPEKRYKGIFDCFIRVPKEQGILSFWRGNGVNIVRACCQESLGYAFKDFFKTWSLNGINPNDNQYRFLLGNLVAGGCSGIATILIIYPLEFIRTRLAIDLGKNFKANTFKYDREFIGMIDCARKIVRHDGVAGVYKGLLPSIQYIMIYRSVYYGLFDFSKPFLSNDENSLGFLRALASAQIVTLIASMLSYPLDTLRRRLMMAAGKKNFMYKGTIECAKHVYVTEGWKAFFSGATVNAMRGTGAALVWLCVTSFLNIRDLITFFCLLQLLLEILIQ
ncbi:putative ADP/ATP translocase 2 [Dictyocaulus viviparus]|uniref:ADP/ATP translocase n=1 Tax=Dictyocaulus viviparus TaxID=29172 RepID=A0A0D8XVW6_DICVI|nr:putative ADP/ATP translocase 2 [Dictyocaulus viviparus]